MNHEKEQGGVLPDPIGVAGTFLQCFGLEPLVMLILDTIYLMYRFACRPLRSHLIVFEGTTHASVL